MPTFINILERLLGRAPNLSTLEQRVLDAVRAQLPAPLVCQWDRQIKAINRVQRLPGGVEVNFYRMVDGRPTFDEAIAFANRSTELQLAVVRVQLDHPDAPAVLVARLWCVKGFVFSIEYDGNPQYVEEALGMDPPPAIEVHCDLIADLAKTA